MDLAQPRTLTASPTWFFRSFVLAAVLIAVIAAALAVALLATAPRPPAVVPGGVGTPAWLNYRADERAMWVVEPAQTGSGAWNSYRADERAVDGAAAASAGH
jgi:hypothetical protein